METLEKRLRSLRLEKKLTQEELAQQLHVTRQAVSNWENGKTVVGIEYLAKLSEIYGVSTDEILYGKRAAEPEKYPQNQGKYIVILAVCAALILLGALLDAVLKPVLLTNYRVRFEVAPYMTYVHLVPAVTGAALGMGIPAMVSLFRDIRIWGRWKRLVLVLAVLVLVPVAVGFVWFLGWLPGRSDSLWGPLLEFSTDVFWNLLFYEELFFLSGLCFFLGINR